MTNILFFYNNLFDLATLAESSQVVGYEAEKTQHPFLSEVWRTSGGGTENLVINHGSAKAITAIVIAGYTWSSAPSTLNFEQHTADAWGAPDGSQALTWRLNPDANGNPNCIIKTFASISKQYNRLNVVYGSNFDVGRIFVGNYFQPTRHFRADQSELIVDPSFKSLSVGGAPHADKITKYRERTVRFRTNSHAQYQLFQAMINSVGITEPLFIAFDYDNYPGEQTMYCELKSYNQGKNFSLYEIEMSFKELVE